MTKDETLKLALDLAIMHHSDDGYAELRSKVRQLAKEALAQDEKGLFIDLIAQHDGLAEELAQPEQEPVVWEAVYETIIQWDEGGGKRSRRELARRILSLYTTPPKRPWVGLTDEEISQLWISTSPYFNEDDFAKAVETKLKEKNFD